MTNAAATIGPHDTWEVGYYYPTFDEGGVPTSPASPFAGHWNGKRWRVINPRGYTTDHVLNGVAEVSKANVWAVGYRLTATNAYRTLIDHGPVKRPGCRAGCFSWFSVVVPCAFDGTGR